MRITLDELTTELKESFEKGLELFNSSLFWEAHEAWEDVWHVLQDERRLYVQGLIQAAATFVHFENNNMSGCRSMAIKALEKLTPYDLQTPLHLTTLVDQLQRLSTLGTLREGELPVKLQKSA